MSFFLILKSKSDKLKSIKTTGKKIKNYLKVYKITETCVISGQ